MTVGKGVKVFRKRGGPIRWRCVADHDECADDLGGACRAQPTNSNPTTKARQRRKGKKK